MEQIKGSYATFYLVALKARPRRGNALPRPYPGTQKPRICIKQLRGFSCITSVYESYVREPDQQQTVAPICLQTVPMLYLENPVIDVV